MIEDSAEESKKKHTGQKNPTEKEEVIEIPDRSQHGPNDHVGEIL